jgi:hypothetical protein
MWALRGKRGTEGGRWADYRRRGGDAQWSLTYRHRSTVVRRDRGVCRIAGSAVEAAHAVMHRRRRRLVSILVVVADRRGERRELCNGRPRRTARHEEENSGRHAMAAGFVLGGGRRWRRLYRKIQSRACPGRMYCDGSGPVARVRDGRSGRRHRST